MQLTKRHKIVFWLSFLFSVGIMLGASFTFANEDFLIFMPGSGRTDFIVLIGIPMVISMILPLFVPRLTPLLVKSMKKFRKSALFVHIPTDANTRVRSFLGRAVLPVLLMFSIANVIAVYIPPEVFFGSSGDNNLIVINLGLFLAPIILAISIIAWTLQDQGVAIWSSQKKREVQVLEGLGRRISTFLQGYAGISAIISYISIVVTTLQHPSGGDWATQFFAYGAPILAMLGYLAYWGVTAVIYEKITTLNNPKLLKKYGLPTYEVILNQVTRSETEMIERAFPGEK